MHEVMEKKPQNIHHTVFVSWCHAALLGRLWGCMCPWGETMQRSADAKEPDEDTSVRADHHQTPSFLLLVVRMLRS